MTRGAQVSSYTSAHFTRLDEVGLYAALYAVFDYANGTFGAPTPAFLALACAQLLSPLILLAPYSLQAARGTSCKAREQGMLCQSCPNALICSVASGAWLGTPFTAR